LGEVAEPRAGGSDFFGVEAEVVGVGEHLLERETRVVEAVGAVDRCDSGRQTTRVCVSFPRSVLAE
jgi:hypothetical protein